MTQHRKSGLILIGLVYLAFVSLGLPDGLIGVAWPSIRAYFHLLLDALGSLLVMFTAGVDRLIARKIGLEIVGPALLFSALVLAGLHISLTVAGSKVGRELQLDL